MSNNINSQEEATWSSLIVDYFTYWTGYNKPSQIENQEPSCLLPFDIDEMGLLVSKFNTITYHVESLKRFTEILIGSQDNDTINKQFKKDVIRCKTITLNGVKYSQCNEIFNTINDYLLPFIKYQVDDVTMDTLLKLLFSQTILVEVCRNLIKEFPNKIIKQDGEGIILDTFIESSIVTTIVSKKFCVLDQDLNIEQILSTHTTTKLAMTDFACNMKSFFIQYAKL
jgi:hypothetical protein